MIASRPPASCSLCRPSGRSRPGGGFARQRRDGTRPFEELDGRPGWQARARWTRPDLALLQLAYLDSRGDRRLHRGQYAWRTRFGAVGGELKMGPALILVTEGAIGDTGMGALDEDHVDMRFAAGYVLLSWAGKKARLSARYDRFQNTDRDGTAEDNGESGHAWTLAAFWLPAERWRLGVELLDVRGGRPAAAASGADPDTDARRVILEARWTF